MVQYVPVSYAKIVIKHPLTNVTLQKLLSIYKWKTFIIYLFIQQCIEDIFTRGYIGVMKAH